jgi:hypothetical protein
MGQLLRRHHRDPKNEPLVLILEDSTMAPWRTEWAHPSCIPSGGDWLQLDETECNEIYYGPLKGEAFNAKCFFCGKGNPPTKSRSPWRSFR